MTNIIDQLRVDITEIVGDAYGVSLRNVGGKTAALTLINQPNCSPDAEAYVVQHVKAAMKEMLGGEVKAEPAEGASGERSVKFSCALPKKTKAEKVPPPAAVQTAAPPPAVATQAAPAPVATVAPVPVDVPAPVNAQPAAPLPGAAAAPVPAARPTPPWETATDTPAAAVTEAQMAAALGDEDEVPVVNETKKEKFKRLATRRLNKNLHGIRLMGNLANTAAYEYTPEQVDIILSSLRDEVSHLEGEFHNEKKDHPLIEL